MSLYRPAVADRDLGQLAAAIRSSLADSPQSSKFENYLSQHSGPVHIQLRKSGRLVASAWQSLPCQNESPVDLLQGLREQASQANELLLCLAINGRSIQPTGKTGWSRLSANMRRGLSAYELRLSDCPEQLARISPFEVVAQNREFVKFLASFATHSGLTLEDAKTGGIQVQEFETEQYWINLADEKAAAKRLFRGCRLVPLAEVDRQLVGQLQRLLSGFLVRSVQADGRMTYLYYPSRGTEDRSRDNSLRQWMATRALIQIWRRSQDPLVLNKLRKNIDYNLQAMYRNDAGLGLIVEGEKVKLGAISLAALALTECPFAKEYADICQRLLATVTFLWQANGEFRTFYCPASRMDCQNFYPGEALLLWSTKLADATDASLHERFWRSFEYYQRWHREHRNPAFIPWHTQAYWNMWRQTPDERLARAIFAMNDWLLMIQQWESASQPDCQGRFYDPTRPFGPPHASSTAVYLEGLADAFALARELGDTRRETNYRLAIHRGLRSLAQLTFKDNEDMFYIGNRDRLRGGVRTSEYNNVVRIDNAQHSLMAIQKLLNVFSEADFREVGPVQNGGLNH